MTLTRITWADAGRGLVATLNRKWTYPKELFFYTWFQGEDTAARYNPCATTWREPGSIDFNKAGVQNYVSWASGKLAWHSTIELNYYVHLREAIVSNNANAMCLALAASPWGTFHSNPEAAIAVLHEVSKDPNLYGAKLIGQP